MQGIEFVRLSEWVCRVTSSRHSHKLKDARVIEAASLKVFDSKRHLEIVSVIEDIFVL